MPSLTWSKNESGAFTKFSSVFISFRFSLPVFSKKKKNYKMCWPGVGRVNMANSEIYPPPPFPPKFSKYMFIKYIMESIV